MPSSMHAYCPYGHNRNTPLPGFNAERYDPVSSTYALGHGVRYYSPALMRFLSTDVLSPFGQGGMNAYMYCAGDPINFVDPTGQSPITAQMLQAAIKARAQRRNGQQYQVSNPRTLSYSAWDKAPSAKPAPQPPRPVSAPQKKVRKVHFSDQQQIMEYPSRLSELELYQLRKRYISAVGTGFEVMQQLERRLNRVEQTAPGLLPNRFKGVDRQRRSLGALKQALASLQRIMRVIRI